MGTLYLDRQSELVRIRNRALVIGSPGTRCTSVPLSLLERIIIQGDIKLSAAVLGRAADAGVSIVMLGARHGRRVAILHGRYHADAGIRIAQYRSHLDSHWRVLLAARFVTEKIRGYLSFLRAKLAVRPDRRRVLKRSIDRLLSALATLREAQTSDRLALGTIRGIEGAASRTAFEALAGLLPPAVGFAGRNRRPPRDPVNATLSLAYTLVHCDAVRAAYAAGLDPYIGYLHDISYGRESLACDLVELLRPEVDRFVCALFNEQVLRARDFSHDAGGCFMKKDARSRFYPEFEMFATRPRRLLRRTVRLLVRRLRSLDEVDPPEYDDDGLGQTTVY